MHHIRDIYIHSFSRSAFDIFPDLDYNKFIHRDVWRHFAVSGLLMRSVSSAVFYYFTPAVSSYCTGMLKTDFLKFMCPKIVLTLKTRKAA